MDKKFNNNDTIKNCLKNGDQVFFEIDTIDLWLQINIGINLGKKKILQGKVQFKISKNTTIASLKKKL